MCLLCVSYFVYPTPCISHSACMSSMYVPSRVSHFEYPTPCITHSVCVCPLYVSHPVCHSVCISPMCIPFSVSHFMYPTPRMTHSVCVSPQYVFPCIPFCVSHFLCIPLCLCFTPCVSLRVFHSVCVPLRECSTPYVFHSVCAPLRTCPTSRVSLPPCVPSSVCIPLHVCPTPCVFHSCVSDSMCPTPYTFHSLCLSILSCLPFLYAPLRVCPSLRVSSLRVFLPPCVPHSMYVRLHVYFILVYLTLCVSLRVRSTPCVFQSLAVPHSFVLHSACAPPSVCPFLRVSLPPCVPHSTYVRLYVYSILVYLTLCVPLRVRSTSCVFQSLAVSHSFLSPISCKYSTPCVYPILYSTPCASHSVCSHYVYFLCVPFPVSSHPHLSHISYPTPCASYSLFTSVRFSTHCVFLTPSNSLYAPPWVVNGTIRIYLKYLLHLFIFAVLMSMTPRVSAVRPQLLRAAGTR